MTMKKLASTTKNMITCLCNPRNQLRYWARSLWVGACNSTIFLSRRFHSNIFRSNLLRMTLPWECHNQSQDTNWRHCVTGPERPFFHRRKGVLKIDQSVKMPWHRLSMGVASSYSSAPDWACSIGLTAFPTLFPGLPLEFLGRKPKERSWERDCFLTAFLFSILSDSRIISHS